MDPLAFKGRHFVLNDVANADCGPGRIGQQRIGTGHPVQAIGQCVQDVGFDPLLAQRGFDDGYDHRQHVLDPVIQLGNQNLLVLFRPCKRADVDKRHNRPVHLALSRQIRSDAHQIMGIVLLTVKPMFVDRAGLEHFADMVAQFRIIAHAGQFRQRAAQIARTQTEEFCRIRSEIADHQILIQENCCNLGRVEQIAQIRIGVIQFLDLAVEFGVDRVQLLVQRLHLLLGGFQLLIGGLRLFVYRDQFLIRGFQLFQRGLVFLDRGLQPLAQFGQLVLGCLVAPPVDVRGDIARIAFGNLKKDDEQPIPARARDTAQWLNPQVDAAHVARGAGNADIASIDCPAGFNRLPQRRPKFQTQIPRHHFQQVPRGCAARHFQKSARPGRYENNLAILAHSCMGRGVLFQNVPFDLVPDLSVRQCRQLAAPGFLLCRDPVQDAAWIPAPVPPVHRLKDAVLLVRREKQIAVLADAFRCPQKQISAGLQGIMKGRYDLPLKVGSEIDQKIAA